MSWERLEKVIEWAGMSTHAFAMKIGMKRSENLYRILRNKENVSIKLAVLILEAYPQINKNWLIYGEGDMLVTEFDISVMNSRVSYYAIPVDGTISEIAQEKPTFIMSIPIFKDAYIAINMVDRSMEPVVPMSSIVILKSASSDVIVYGQTYYIETVDSSFVRVIRKSESSDKELILEAANNRKYDSITINRDKISKIYPVCGVLNRFF